MIEEVLNLAPDGVWFYASWDDTQDRSIDQESLHCMGFKHDSQPHDFTNSGYWDFAMAHPTEKWTYGKWNEAITSGMHEPQEVIFNTANDVYVMDGNAKGGGLRFKTLDWSRPDIGTTSITAVASGMSAKDYPEQQNDNLFFAYNYPGYGIVNLDSRPFANGHYNGFLFSPWNQKVTALATGDIGTEKMGIVDRDYIHVMPDRSKELFMGWSNGDVIVNYSGTYGKTHSLFHDSAYFGGSSAQHPVSAVTALATGYIHGPRHIQCNLYNGDYHIENYDNNDDILIGYENGKVYIHNGMHYVGELFSRQSAVSALVAADINGDALDEIIIGFNDGNLDVDLDGSFGNTLHIKKFDSEITEISAGFYDKSERKNVFVGLRNGDVFKIIFDDDNRFTIDILIHGLLHEVSALCTADINGDGWDEVIVGDVNGSIAIKDRTTKEPSIIQLEGLDEAVINAVPSNYTFLDDGNPEAVNHLLFNQIYESTDVGFSLSKGRAEFNYDKQFTFDLCQNYPNPFNPATTIAFTIPEKTNARLDVFDLLGRKVAELTNKEYQPGNHTLQWDASNYPTGVYFYTLVTNKNTMSKKLLIIK
ncbi:MAG: T9SS type A sorting domain-containing protein [Ignavibacteriales bacterium]|nr:T9SS type A sorting domain-containing protein [Ignavibacteriales bacterium]